MKVVLDTNVVISGIFFSGPPYKILQAWRAKDIQIVASVEIINEYRRVAKELADQFSGIDVEEIFELIVVHSELIDDQGFTVSVCEDPDDDKFLSCAIASGSKIIVSGDKHLLKISGFRGISILKPREFVDSHLTPR